MSSYVATLKALALARKVVGHLYAETPRDTLRRAYLGAALECIDEAASLVGKAQR